MVKWSIPGAFFVIDKRHCYILHIFMMLIYKNKRYDLLIRLDLLYFPMIHMLSRHDFFSAPLGLLVCVTRTRSGAAPDPSLGYRRQVKRLALPIVMLEQTPFFGPKKGTNCTLNTSDFRPRNAEKQFISLFSRFAASSNSAAATSQQQTHPMLFPGGKRWSGR